MQRKSIEPCQAFPVSLRAENERLRLLCAAADKRVSESLVLLRESDHRIKNSLQLVASMLMLQAGREDKKAAATLRAAASRTQSIGHIHDALQTSGGQDVVDLRHVINALCESLRAISGPTRHILVSVDSDVLFVPIALARPIALAVNELVLNALRHAFPLDRAGTIQVIVTQPESGLRIVVADDGDGFDADQANGFGTTLINTMAAQVGATLTRKSNPGAQITLTMPAHNPHVARISTLQR